jgi:anti-sigma B factor antagonist
VGFSFDVESLGTVRVLVLGGELDIATTPKVRRVLHDLLAESADPLVVDLGGVGFMDSSGLAVLVSGHKRACVQGTPYAVSRLRPPVAKVFALTHADQLIPVLDEVTEPPLAPV